MSAQRLVVVTGGAAGIGAAIAEALGREGAFVVTMDPVVSLDGSTRLDTAEPTTAERIVEAGGSARASGVSVTDGEAVRDLFVQLADEFGSLDAVVNVAGISRPTSFAEGAEEDWAGVLSVHLEGYLNVLGAALPIMEKAGHGRILGVTSGSGWRPANTGAYGCAKRAVAALTWQVGKSAPSGVTVNALSPIAVTRMVTAALPPQDDSGDGDAGVTGGLLLGSMPPPENLGPIGAYLAGEDFGWCTGQVIFSSGAEAALITEPHLLEVVRSREVSSLPHVLAELVPLTLVPAESAQVTDGGTNPRSGPVFDDPGESSVPAAPQVQRCVVVSDDAHLSGALGDALEAGGVDCVTVGAGAPPEFSELAVGFAGATAQVAAVAAGSGPIDAVIVALAEDAGTGRDPAATAIPWSQVLAEHAGIADQIRTDASWVRAASDYSSAADRPVRVVTVTRATSAGGRSRAQASAQLARAAHIATSGRVDAVAVSVESAADSDWLATAGLVAHLATGPDTAALSGAELVASSGWFGLRAHPRPTGSISFGGPKLPDWFDVALREVVGVSGTDRGK